MIFSTLIVLLLIPSLACTRSANSPQQLTAIAERGMVARVTEAFLATEAQKHITPTATFTNTPTETLLPEVETATAAALLTATVTQTPTMTPTVTYTPTITPTVPTPRSTFPVETIAPGTATATAAFVYPTSTPTPDIPIPELKLNFTNKAFYAAQTGDTAQAIALRYGTTTDRLIGLEYPDSEGFLKPGTLLLVNNAPKRNFSSGMRILPDEYIVMGYPSIGYDLAYEVEQAGGFLSSYEEYTSSGTLSGTEIIQKVALDYSVSPIVLLELLEYKSHWVYGQPRSIVEEYYPLGWLGENSQGLYKQMTWAAQELSLGYYGWRYGKISEIPFYKYPQPEEPIYFNPNLNAGSVAIQY